ncbi:FKBP-type peptidyl-prolyl cis-trans isomerase SlyD [hydrothermal vent metagenome]|uniref:peptidylprolyl isomerase n=1 Tax=hydrothermal vent metagenome TaxID=652676 RepID=A0A1W1E0M8_9ZZZZ
MTVKKDKVVEMHYTLKNDNGDIIDTSKGQEPMPFLQGHGNVVPGLEKAIEGLKKGDTCDVAVEAKDAYGEFHAEAVQEIPMEALQEVPDLKVGMELQSQDENGNPFIVIVKKIEGETVTVDANHPLAGQTLHFSVSIEGVRDATENELEHGHVHAHDSSCSH